MGRFMCSSVSAMSLYLKLGLSAGFGRVLWTLCVWYFPSETLRFDISINGVEQMRREEGVVDLSPDFRLVSISRVHKCT